MAEHDESCKCENVVVRCMDYRFHAQLPALLSAHFGVERFEYDSPGVGAGGSLSLIDERSRALVLEAVQRAVALHGVKRLIIVDHIDCGAWGGSERFDNPEEEQHFHAARLREAREIASDACPELEIVLFYQDREGVTRIT